MILAASLLAGCADRSLPPRQIAGADPDRGRRIAERAGCGACHEIPGVRWPQGRTGGPLLGFADRPLIAGRLPNQRDVTGMPATTLSAAEARDLAAFLYTLE